MTDNHPDWAKIRAQPFSTTRPSDWPEGVSALNWDGYALIGVNHQTKEIYWDGQKLATEKRFSSFERGLAIAGLVIALVGVAATVVQAWAAISPAAKTNYQTCLQNFEQGWTAANGKFTGADRIASLSACQNAL